mgnify:CR=1 FL=1
MSYNILIADQSHISKLVDIGLESFTESCEIEIRKRIDNDFCKRKPRRTPCIP